MDDREQLLESVAEVLLLNPYTETNHDRIYRLQQRIRRRLNITRSETNGSMSAMLAQELGKAFTKVVSQ